MSRRGMSSSKIRCRCGQVMRSVRRQRPRFRSDTYSLRMTSLYAHQNAVESLLSTYPELFEELSPQRAEIVNSASEMRECLPQL